MISPFSVTVPEKLDYIISRYSEHNHEKWCIEKVRTLHLESILEIILSAPPSGSTEKPDNAG